jgi:cysteinyl-tRNA synthetase
VLHLYDTALGSVEPLDLRRPGELTMYVCGPTVYGDPHIGHGRFNLVWDVIRRYAAWQGLNVTYVSNITDIDDKIINRARDEGTTAAEVATTWEAAWWAAMDRLGVDRPDAAPHATAYVPGMVELIAELIDRGSAYVGGDGVYFASETVADYGLLARQPLEALRAGARVEVSAEAGKRAPVDFVLWKMAKPGEPSWDSPWGKGRPGWHTECVVMSLDLLGDGFDLHGGGIDLAFPHHENERAQAVADGHRFTRRWVHNEMVITAGGEKMSKSLGNTVSLREVLERHDPRAYRLLVLQSHYRSPMTVNEANLESADRTVAGLDGFARDFAAARGTPPDPAILEQFAERMDDDLDTPRAVAILFVAMRAARTASGEKAVSVAAAVLELWERALGLRLDDGRGTLRLDDGHGKIPPEARAKAAERDEARAARDWARADQLRRELTAEGWVVEDTPGGTVLRRESR